MVTNTVPKRKTPRTMNEAFAIALEIHGKRAMVEDLKERGGQSSPVRRSEAHTALAALRAKKPVRVNINEWPDDASVHDYRLALAKYYSDMDTYRLNENKLMHEANYYRYRVGKDTFAFVILGHGDTWAEALENSRTK